MKSLSPTSILRNGRPTVTHRPRLPPRSQSFVEFTVPEGEGAGPSGAGSLYSVSVSVGGQLTPSFGFSYAAPVVSSLSSPPAGTAGGSVLWVFGASFGFLSTPVVSLALAPATAALLPNGTAAYGYCTGVVRLNHSALYCKVPQVCRILGFASCLRYASLPLCALGRGK